jgi:hypothetical protein
MGLMGEVSVELGREGMVRVKLGRLPELVEASQPSIGVLGKTPLSGAGLGVEEPAPEEPLGLLLRFVVEPGAGKVQGVESSWEAMVSSMEPSPPGGC